MGLTREQFYDAICGLMDQLNDNEKAIGDFDIDNDTSIINLVIPLECFDGEEEENDEGNG